MVLAATFAAHFSRFAIASGRLLGLFICDCAGTAMGNGLAGVPPASACCSLSYCVFSSLPMLYETILLQSILVLVMGSCRRIALNVVSDMVW